MGFLERERHIFLIRVIFSKDILIFGKKRIICSGIFHIHRTQKILLFLAVVEKPSDHDEDRSDTLESDTVPYDDILIKKDKTPDRVEYHQRQEKKGHPRGHDDGMVGKGEMRLGFQFFLSRTGKEEKAQNAVDDDDHISDITHMDTERTTLQRIIHNGEPVEEKREERKENTDAYYSRTAGKIQKVETQTGKKRMYFIF